MNELIDKWINATCGYFSIVDRNTLLNPPDRDQYIIDARKVAMYLLRKHVGLRDKPIGKLFHRDRSTIAYHIKTVDISFVNGIENVVESRKQEEMAI